MRISERAPRVWERLATGESLSAICADPGLPDVSTVHRWIHERPDLQLAYARAQRLRADRLADQIIEIADALDREAGQEEARSARMRIDARKHVMSHLVGAIVSAEETPPAPGRIVFCTPSDFASETATEFPLDSSESTPEPSEITLDPPEPAR